MTEFPSLQYSFIEGVEEPQKDIKLLGSIEYQRVLVLLRKVRD